MATLPHPGGIALKVERADLLKATAGALGAVENKVTNPILSHFLLEAEGDALVITGTNLDAQTTARIPAVVTQPGSVTVAAQALYDIARKAREDAPVAITSNPDNDTTTVTSGRARFNMPGLDPKTFYRFEGGAGGFGAPIEIAGSILANMIARCQFAISTEETRYYLNGIYCHCVEIEGRLTLRFVATTGTMLARIDTTRAAGLDPAMPGAIMPRKAVDLIRKLAETAGDAPVTLELSSRMVRVTAGEVAFVSKLIEATFPDYVRVIPTQFERECVAPTLALIQAAERVSSIAQEKLRGLRLSFKADTLAIGLRDTNGGEASDELDVELEGEPLEIGFSAKWLTDILAQVGSDTVRLKLGAHSMAPVVVGDKLGEGLFVLMPLRI